MVLDNYQLDRQIIGVRLAHGPIRRSVVHAAWVGATVGDLTSVLPFHGIAGAGTYEAGVVAGLAPYGLTPESALPLAVNLHLFILASSTLLGLIAWLIPARLS